ncbi:hypothetical protein TNCV_472231 [Trichonephila clavipes]|nr:hypothetical protein TNCV_472231 [Trichonephila clavipes]
MDVCKCSVPSRQGDALNSRKSSREVSGRKRGGKPLTTPLGPRQNWGENEKNRTVTCVILKVKANDKRKNLTLSCDEFRGLDLMLLFIRWHKQQQLYLLVT